MSNEFREVRTDEYTGEILSGGNTFVSVDYDDELMTEASVENANIDFE